MRIVATDRAPRARPSYSQAVVTGATVMVSGQVGRDPASGELAEGVANQTRQCLANLAAVLEEAGSSLGLVVKTTCLLSDIGQFGEFDATYLSLMPDPKPVRTTFGVDLNPGILVEIDAIAELADP